MNGARCKSAFPRKFFLGTMPGLALGLGLGLGLPGLAQKPNPGTGGMTPGVESTPSNLSDSLGRPVSPDDPVYQERRMRHLALETHKSMVSDTDKLLQLVTELNSEISARNSGAFTADQLRKIAQIEKLAHSVRQKMGDTLQGTQDTMLPMHDGPTFHH
jgi:hypothetical protein